MTESIWLNRQAGEAFKKRLKKLRVYYEEDEQSLAKAERLAAGLSYASISSPIRDARRSTADTIARLEAVQREYEEYERALEEWDRESAGLLGNIPQIKREDIKDRWPLELVEALSNLQIRQLFESQGAKVDWDGATRTITITFQNGDTQTLAEGEDFHIVNGVAHFIVREAHKVTDYVPNAKWDAATRTISYLDSAGNPMLDKNGEPIVLREHVDFYCSSEGKAYYYNNVRTMLEASGATVDYQKTPGGGSTIAIAGITAATAAIAGALIIGERVVLTEGVHYYIGADGRAHFYDKTFGAPPPGPVKSTVTSSGKIILPSGTGEYMREPVMVPNADKAAYYYKQENYQSSSGNNTCSATTIAIGLSILLDREITPYMVMGGNPDKDSKVNMTWINGVGMSWSTSGGNRVPFSIAERTHEEAVAASLHAAYAELQAGRPVGIVANGSYDEHYVIAIGYQNVGGSDWGNFIIIDPTGGQIKQLSVYDPYNRGTGRPAIVKLENYSSIDWDKRVPYKP